MEHLVHILKVGTQEQMAKELADFYTQFGIDKESYKYDDDPALIRSLLNILFDIIRDPEKINVCPLALQVIRIFSRNGAIAESQFNSDRIETLLHLAMLVGEEEAFMTETSQSFDAKIIVEAQKCLSNLLSVSSNVRKICCQNSCVEGIMLRLRMHPDPKLPHEVKHFDMLMLFLLTALCVELRSKVTKEYHGMIYLMEAIDLILKNNAEYLAENAPNKSKRRSKGSRRGRKGGQVAANDIETTKDDAQDGRFDDTLVAYCLDDWEVELAIQVLKVLFSLTLDVDKSSLDEDDENHFCRLVSILHDLLLCDTKSEVKKEIMQSNIVNLLTNMPGKSYEELLSKISELGKPENPEHEYDEMNMEVVVVLLKFLEKRLENFTSRDAKEKLAPILTCLIKASSSQPIIRKYLRYQILPPLREFKSRPEEGLTIRNKLIRLMVTPEGTIDMLAATFLFILCKENVARLIKYTGYGNAAGLLARKGLMRQDLSQNSIYSSDSDESDTEEYLENVNKINPVVGCIQDEGSDPFEGMSEEQKEYEAVCLINMIDKLQRQGIIKPCTVGDDGRPVDMDIPAELERRRQLAEQNENENENDYV